MKSGTSGNVEEQDEGGERIGPQHGQEDEQGDEAGQVHLGQVLGEVRVERVDPADQRVRELAGALARGEARAEGEQPPKEAIAHGQAHATGEALGQDLLAPDRGRAQRSRSGEARAGGAQRH